MMDLFYVFELLALVFVSVHGIKLEYKLYANLTSGSLLPSEHLSRYQIMANLKVNISDKFHIFQIENIFVDDSNVLNSSLNLPFKVDFLNDSTKIFADINDEVWSLNMKKSLITLFDLNKKAYEEGAFSVKENNTHGTCDVEYITKRLNSSLKITKLIDEASCSNSPTKRRSNTPFFVCPSTFQEGIAAHHERMYTLLFDEYPYINEIKSIGTIYFQPFQALAEAHYIHVNQILKLVNIENHTEVVIPDTLMNLTDITYVTDIDRSPIFGFFPVNKSALKSEIHQLLENLAESLDWKLSTSNLDNQTAFHVLELMWWLDISDWEELYQMVSLGTSYTQETLQHFFWELIPQVGSESSVIFIKNLVTSKKVKHFSASLLLVTFPLHIKHTSEKLLLQLEDLLHLRDFENQIKNSGILSFATLIHKTCQNQCNVELLDRYTKYLLDQFMESTNYQDQMVYLQALNNMQIIRILDFLKPIIINPSYSRHIRYSAIWVTLRTIEKYPAEVTEIFWPIFANRSESLEIRVAAMSVLITTQPSTSRLLTFFWHMQGESNYHIYNFFYTTVQSIANTKYPCFHKLRHIASQLNRYLLPRAYRWATGNYILDYEDTIRGYGGIIHFFIVASENTGLPSSIYLSTEQHSHGLSSKFSIYLKAEGVVDIITEWLSSKNNLTSIFPKMNVTNFHRNIGYSVRLPEQMHVELIVKIDGNTLYCRHLNHTSLTEIFSVIEQTADLYSEFSVNYQRLRFPLHYEVLKLTDLGTSVALQIRTVSMLSLRGSIIHEEKGKHINTELDFRYSMNTVTGLRTFNPFSKKWHGTDRIRSLHATLPFSIHIFNKTSMHEITFNRHKEYIGGSLFGFVWHSTIKLFPAVNKSNENLNNGNNYSNHWTIQSRDLGARFDAKIFHCQGENDILNSFFIIKEAFELSNKNFKMVIGGVPILGLYSLLNYFTFLPPGDSCGIIISMLPSQVQLAFISEGSSKYLIMRNETKLKKENEQDKIWQMKYKEVENEGLTRNDFRLENYDTEKDLAVMNSSWRLIQFEGNLNISSYRQGILNAPNYAEGQAKLSWGHIAQATTIKLELHSENTVEKWPAYCENNTASCYQIASNLATRLTVILNCVNLPIWLTTALLSVFPDNVHADKKFTKLQFSVPAKIPWTSDEGVCVINENFVLNFDNSTVQEYKQHPDCYSLAISDCSLLSYFVIGIRKSTQYNNILELKVIAAHTTLVISSLKENVIPTISINDTIITLNNVYQFYPLQSNFLYQFKYWEKSKMVEIVVGHSGLLLQYYGGSVVAIADSKLRGKTCGLCGDFNGEVSNDDASSTPCIKEFKMY